MPRDWMDFDSAPIDEPDNTCVKSGEDYLPAMMAEARRYKKLVEETCFPNAPEGVECYVVTCPHDFGGYTQLRISYDESDREQFEFVLWLECNLPNLWTDTEVRKYPPEEVDAKAEGEEVQRMQDSSYTF